jgi:prepilin-type N-terminal cleavage/methylation domain-containing protein
VGVETVQRRGFTLIEVSFALAMLTIVVGAAFMIAHVSNRHQSITWDELVAGEYANSLIEHILSENICMPTQPSGRSVDEMFNEKDSKLFQLAAVLNVTHAINNPEFVDVRVTITWRRTESPLEGQVMRVERSVRRRVKP